MRKTFPGLFHEEITTQDVSRHWGSGRKSDLSSQVRCQLTNRVTIAAKEYIAKNAEFPLHAPQKPAHRRHDGSLDKSIAHFRHAQQPAFETCVAALKSKDGVVLDWSPIDRSFLAGFVHGVHSKGSNLGPCILLHRKRMTLSLVFTVQHERLLSTRASDSPCRPFFSFGWLVIGFQFVASFIHPTRIVFATIGNLFVGSHSIRDDQSYVAWLVLAWPCWLCAESKLQIDTDGRLERFLITDIGGDSTFFVVPVRVCCDNVTFNTQYAIEGAAMPILQYVLLRGLEHVARVTVDGLFRFMNWPTSTSDDQSIGKLLEAFGSELGMLCMQEQCVFSAATNSQLVPFTMRPTWQKQLQIEA